MAAFLQKTLCWLSGTVTGNQQLGHSSSQIQRSAGDQPPQRGRRRLRTQMADRRAGKGPRQQQGGAQQIYRCNPSGLMAQRHPRPCGSGKHRGARERRTRYPGDSESSKLDGAKRWGANQRLLLCERAGVWGERAIRGRGTQGMRDWQPSGASVVATETPLDACGYIPAHMASLEHRDRRIEGLERS